MYADGEGVLRNDAEALRWYRKAAEQGNAAAQANLGLMYLDGQGVDEDDVEAYKWLSLAVAGGSKLAAKELDDLETSLTPEELADARQRAAVWRPRGAAGAPQPPAAKE